MEKELLDGLSAVELFEKFKGNSMAYDDIIILPALRGGIGVIHRNMSIEEQYKNGFIVHPICLKEDNTIADVLLIQQNKGFSGIPITETGQIGSKLIGLITKRDCDFQSPDTPLSKLMTRELIVAKDGCSLEEANELIKKNKKGKLPIVNEKYELVKLVSRTDLKKQQDYPLVMLL